MESLKIKLIIILIFIMQSSFSQKWNVFLSKIKNDFLEINYIDIIYDVKTDKNYYYIFSAKKDQFENKSIFIMNINDPIKINKYIYPGEIFDYETNKLFFESKLYLLKRENKIKKCIWWQNENSVKSLFIVEIVNNKIQETSIKYEDEKYNKIIKDFKYCIEIKGIDITSEP